MRYAWSMVIWSSLRRPRFSELVKSNSRVNRARYHSFGAFDGPGDRGSIIFDIQLRPTLAGNETLFHEVGCK